MKSSFKVGILTLVALIILLFTILWVKGRAFSSAERIEIFFKDVNGMRPGSGVQMMGLRVGQVEEIIPVVDNESSYVKLRFVITDPNVSIPKASMISIQQSGLIGEQFLEITPPKTNSVYIPMLGNDILYKNDPVQIELDDKFYDVGFIRKTQVLSSQTVPSAVKEIIKTKYAYKIDYVVNLPGLILPEFMAGEYVNDKGVKKIRIYPLDHSPLPYPQQTSPYTIVEPMRIADFMDWQYKAAESLTQTNRKINDLLSDEVIEDLKVSVVNINELTAQSKTTIEKAEKLIDASQEDLDTMIVLMNQFTNSFVKLSGSINSVIDDENFKPTLYSSAESLSTLSRNLNKILAETDSKQLANDLNATMKNINEISHSVNTMTKDENLKKEISGTIDNVNRAMCDISNALEVVNGLTPDKKNELGQIMEDVSASASNLRKFTDKLNKRFLLFRLMF